MKRRDFFRITGGTAGLLAPFTVGAAETVRRQQGVMARALDGQHEIGGRSLEALIARYHYDLFDDFLPFMHDHIIDHQYGGFMTHADRAGKQLSTTKRTRYQGRGLWVYAHLYRTLAREERYLAVARGTVELLLRSEPGDSNLWPSTLTRDGTPMGGSGSSGRQVYDELFVANGFAEYARAAGETAYRERAIAMLANCERLYDAEDYAPDAPRSYMGNRKAPPLPGCRLLGVWMVMLRLATQLLEAAPDARVEALADRCLEAIMTHHRDTDFDLLVEVLRHDFTPPEGVYAQLAYTGHSIETLWMVMAEAVRRKERALFDAAAGLLRRHLAVSWDDVYGGWYRGCLHVDKNDWILDKASWAQEEALVGLLLIIEHTGAEWAKAWFRRGYTYVIEHFPLKPHGYALWDLYPDRKVTFVEEFNRIGNFHHPRHLMLNLEALQRIKARGGGVADTWQPPA